MNAEDHLYLSGSVNWTKITNEMILKEFKTPEEMDAIDAIAAHVYSKEPAIPNSREFLLNSVEQSWLSENPDLEIWVTEWNQKANTNAFDTEKDFGLKQAAEMTPFDRDFCGRSPCYQDKTPSRPPIGSDKR